MKNWEKCTKEERQLIQEMYPDVEKRLAPVLKREAHRFAQRNPEYQFEDALQEGRMAMLNAMANYDYNRAIAGLDGYLSRVLRNTFASLTERNLAQHRMPHVEQRGEQGWTRRPTRPTTIDGHDFADELIDKLDFAEREQAVRLVNVRLQRHFESTGHQRDKAVHRCMAYPPAELRNSLIEKGADEVGALDIANHLGLGQNAVDWSMNKVRAEATVLITGEFSELFDAYVKRGWPMIHSSPRIETYDEQFVNRIIAKRRLDARAGEPEEIRGEGCWRRITPYSWGVALGLEMDGDHRTLVIEGRFNSHYGIAYGVSGGPREYLTQRHVPWYNNLTKKLRRKS